MSIESVALEYRAIRRRLMNPPNGRASEETEVISETALRQQRLKAAAEQVLARKQAKIAAQVARLEALKITYATTLARRGFGHVRLSSAQERVAEPLPPRAPFIQSIVAEVCRRYKVTPVDVRSQRRTANVVLPRQIIMYIARTITELSLPQIGRQLGGRDHTTCLHASNKIAALVENSPHLAAEINDIIATLAARQHENTGDG